jgi:hypothetical protein
MGEVARGRATLAIGGEDLDLVIAKNDAIARRFASPRLAAMGDALISQSTGRSAATFCPHGGSATLSSMWS